MDDNRNTILAIALSLVILIAWQFFIGAPKVQDERDKQVASQEMQAAPTAPGSSAPAAGSARHRIRAARRRRAAPHRRPPEHSLARPEAPPAAKPRSRPARASPSTRRRWAARSRSQERVSTISC